MVDSDESKNDTDGADDGREVRDGTPAWARRIKQKLDSVEKPKKVTRDDVLNRWDDTYDKRVETVKKVRQPATISKIVTIGALVASVWMGVSTASGGSSFDSSSKANQTQIDSLKGDLTDAQKVTEQVPTKEQGASLVVAAYEQGKSVANVQNQMIARSKNPDADEMAKLSKKMMTFVSSGAYAATSQWYYIDPAKNNPYRATNYEWVAETPYEFNVDGKNIRVTWLCRDTKTKVVLAWAQGDYSASSKKFDGFAWGSTLEGDRRVGTPIDDDDPQQKASSSASPTETKGKTS